MPIGIKGFSKGVHWDTEFKNGDKHPLWRGDAVGYKSLHEWISVSWGKAKDYLCSCGFRALDWANITGIYNRDRDNWRPMCRSCHKKFDGADTSKAREALRFKRKSA